MASELFSQDVVPIGTGYLILMGVLAAGLRLLGRDEAKSNGQDAADAAGPDGQASKIAGEGQLDRERKKGRAGLDGTGPGGKKPGLIARQFPPGWPRFGAEIASVALGGYLLLISVDILYYFG